MYFCQVGSVYKNILPGAGITSPGSNLHSCRFFACAPDYKSALTVIRLLLFRFRGFLLYKIGNAVAAPVVQAAGFVTAEPEPPVRAVIKCQVTAFGFSQINFIPAMNQIIIEFSYRAYQRIFLVFS